MLVPQAHGGLEVSPQVMMDALRRLFMATAPRAGAP